MESAVKRKFDIRVVSWSKQRKIMLKCVYTLPKLVYTLLYPPKNKMYTLILKLHVLEQIHTVQHV